MKNRELSPKANKTALTILNLFIQLINWIVKKERFKLISFDNDNSEWVIGELTEYQKPVPVYRPVHGHLNTSLVEKGAVLAFDLLEMKGKEKIITRMILADKIFFDYFTESERVAVLKHEEGHIVGNHLAASLKQRIKMVFHHEVLADAYAIRNGHGKALKSAITKLVIHMNNHYAVDCRFINARVSAIAAILGGNSFNLTEATKRPRTFTEEVDDIIKETMTLEWFVKKGD